MSLRLRTKITWFPHSSCGVTCDNACYQQLAQTTGRTASSGFILPGVTEKVPTSQLRQLQADGVLARKATADIPPKVTYFLTREGKKLVPLMEDLCAWGSKHFGIKPTLSRAS